jgi:hypothetical protein
MGIDALTRSQMEAIEHSVGRYTVGFAFSWQGQQHVDMASGVAVRWGNKRLIVTAKHVLSDLKDEDGDAVRLGLPVDRPFSRDDEVRLPPKWDAQITARPLTKIFRSEPCDLAFFEVDDDFGRSTDLEFHGLPAYARTPEPPAGGVMMRFQKMSRFPCQKFVRRS